MSFICACVIIPITSQLENRLTIVTMKFEGTNSRGYQVYSRFLRAHLLVLCAQKGFLHHNKASLEQLFLLLHCHVLKLLLRQGL